MHSNSNEYTNQSRQIISVLNNITNILRSTESHLYSNSLQDNSPFRINTLPPRPVFNIATPTNSITNPINTTTTNINNRNTNLFSDFVNNLTPVRVNPTSSQIANATRLIQFNNINDPINNNCPIRHERFQNTDIVMQIRHCRHIFNHRALTRWFDNSVRCPVCRYDIRDYFNPDNSIEPESSSEINEENSSPEINEVHDNSNDDVSIDNEPIHDEQHRVIVERNNMNTNDIEINTESNALSITAVFNRDINQIRNTIVNQISEVIEESISNFDPSNNTGIISIEYSIENIDD